MDKETKIRLENLEKNVLALASRPYSERADEAKGEAIKAQTSIEVVNSELIDSAITITDFLEEYYMSQYGL